MNVTRLLGLEANGKNNAINEIQEKSSDKIRKQDNFYKKEKIDPKNATVILFPGQGYQYVGMVKDLLKYPAVEKLFERASNVLKYDLLKICLEGPQDKLSQTKYCQPAIVVSSLAALEKLKEERPDAIDNCVATAGFSLGEMTALIFAGALEFERGLELVQIRADGMQFACEAYKGGMMRVVYTPESDLSQAYFKAKEWAKEKGDENPECHVANYLWPNCEVAAGSISALDYLEKNVEELKLVKVTRLNMYGGFHTSLMLPAVEPFKKALEETKIEDPVINVYSNVDGERYKNADHIRRQLSIQVVKPVKWQQTLQVIYERDFVEYLPTTFECGPGTSLKTILLKANENASNNFFNISV